MGININNLVIDRVIRNIFQSISTDETLAVLTQIEEPVLNCTSTQNEVTDAIGGTIALLDRAKKVEVTANNSLFDFNLAALQFGSKKKVADETHKIICPCIQQFVIKDGQTEIELDNVPVGIAKAEIKYIGSLNPDGTYDKSYKLGATASEIEFALDAATKKITLPTDLTENTEIIVKYDYEAVSAVEVDDNATEFPTNVKSTMQILCHDVCKPDVKYFAYVICPNVKFRTEVNLSFTPTGKHPIAFDCMQNYCDREKKLFKIVVPE